jgi:RecB family endonuclease NucS
MRLLVARCDVVYTDRLTATLPEAVRLIVLKTDGSVLVHDDSGNKPLNTRRYAVRSYAPLLQETHLRGRHSNLE